MITRWNKFNESDNQDVITKDNIKEVLSFKWFAVFNSNVTKYFGGQEQKILVKYGKLNLILPELNLSNDLEEDNIDKIYNEIKGKLEEDEIRYKLRETFIELFQLISIVMEGFPRFYEMEDCVLSYMDDGYEIEYEIINQSMSVIIRNHINIPEYVKLVSNSTHIINRLKNFTKKEIFVSDSEYINKSQSQLKITIR